ncbi:MAG: oligosaccharide repeat unit polymerase [Spirochaetes bacterium]|nr:oligosaccharide repeat unit polymerase [Spirochaetota bacterium]
MILIFIIGLYLVTAFTRILNKTFLTPAGINNILWTFFLTVGYLLQDQFMLLYPLGVFCILLWCLFFSLGSFFFQYSPPKQQIKVSAIINHEFIPGFRKFLISFFLLQLLFIPLAAKNNFNIPFIYFLQPINMSLIGLKVRYDPSYITAAYMNALQGLNFASFLLLGFYLALKDILKIKFHIGVTLSSLIMIYLSLMLALMFNAKSSILICVTMLASSFLATQFALNPDKLWYRRKLGSFILIIGLSFVAFILLIMIRYNSGDIAIIRNTLLTYGFGHNFCFTNFIHLELDQVLFPRTFGMHTFYSFLKFVGYRLPEGVYEDVLTFGNGFHSNVYTFLRGFIYDFGLIGFPLVTFLFSYIIHEWNLLAIRTQSLKYVAFLSITYHFLLYSFVISTFIYVNILLSYVAFISFLLFFQNTFWCGKSWHTPLKQLFHVFEPNRHFLKQSTADNFHD